MFNLFRSGLSAASMILVLTVAGCCPRCEPTETCPGPSEEPSADMEMDDMGMPTKACALVDLTANDPKPPLYSGIGSAHLDVPPWAQAYFDQGLRFYFAFNNRESYRAFRQAAYEAEGNGIPCSACYWAQALVLGVDLNMSEQSEPDRLEAKFLLHRSIEANPSPQDWEMIRALFGRYQDCNIKDAKDRKAKKECQWVRNQAYFYGMKRVLDTFGANDPNVIALFADSAMNLAPWTYWDENGDPNPKASEPIREALNQLERALKFPEPLPNEGPIHWYIHLMEQSPNPGDAKQYADWLAPPAPLAPNAGHLVHMPSHIYFRMGDMQNAIRANKAAIDADERYFATEPDLYRPDGDRYRYSYYPHNIHFVIAAAALSGDNKEQDINRYAEKLLKSLPDKANGMRADIYRAVYYLAKVNFSNTADIRKFARPDAFERQPVANIAYDFTQLMADIWDKDKEKSNERLRIFDDDVARYRKYQPEKGRENLSCDTPPGRAKPELCLTAVLESLGHGRVEALKGNWVDAVSAATRAVDIQDALKYTEPPLWPYPARQTLASILIQRAIAVDPATVQGRANLAGAQRLLLKSLNQAPRGNPNEIPTGTFPGNGWAYYGLWAIADRGGPGDVNQAKKDLDDHWFGTDDFRNLDRM
jgi:tetratricopeptide (TPR) repeat protein